MNRAASYAIETIDLVKRFGANIAVDHVNLQVEKGTIFGLLGPNGAGKTTLVRLLATLLQPSSGRASVLGCDVAGNPGQVRRQISLTGQFASVDEELTGSENLVLLARLLGFRRRAAKMRAAALLEGFGLSDAARRQVRTYSGGMRRRLDIAASIIATPELLFLDEPTTGLDPRSREQVWAIIRALVSGGATVLLTTQYLEEADQLADRIAVIDHGRVIAEGTSAELKASVGNSVLHVRMVDSGQRAAALSLLSDMLDGQVHPQADPRAITAQISDPKRATDALSAIAAAELRMSDFSVGQPSLDEVFFALTGKMADELDDGDEATKTVDLS